MTMKSEETYITVELQIDSELFAQFKETLLPYGLTPEEAIILLINETVRQGRIPFAYTEQDLLEAKRLFER